MRIQPIYLPTQQQIATECKQIRRRWTPKERQRREVGNVTTLSNHQWIPPVIDTSVCGSRVRQLLVEQSA